MAMHRRRSVWLAAVAVAGGLLLVWQASLRGSVDELPAAHPSAATQADPVARTGRTPAEAAPRRVGERVQRPDGGLAALRERLGHSSLRGATPDGELSLDDAGRVRPDLGLRRLFDHFLSLSGEFSPSEIRALVADRVRATLGDGAVGEVLHWFNRYCDLILAMDGAAFPSDPLARAAHLRTLRRQYLGDAVAEAWFAVEDADLDLALARLAVRDAPGVDPDERQQWLDELDQTRTNEVQDVLRASLDAALVQAQADRFEAENADAATRRAERTALWGEDAAERLAQLDAERADWAVRLQHYRTARTAMAAEPAAFDAWLQANFSEPERRRILALDAIDDVGP